MANSEAEKNANVRKILMQHKLTEKDSSRKESYIENQMYLDRQKSLADADYYRYSLRKSSVMYTVLIRNGRSYCLNGVGMEILCYLNLVIGIGMNASAVSDAEWTATINGISN